MRPLLCLLAFAITGCATDPYPIAPQSVTIHFLDDSEWSDFTRQRTYDGAWGMPWQIGGSAKWETNEDGEIISCDIYFPAGEPPTRYLLSHELRHCVDGYFH